MPGHLTKDSLRARARRARERLSPSDWAREDDARFELWRKWLGERPTDTLACYASRPGEPGTGRLIDEAHASGWRILLPVLSRRVGWAWFEGWAAMAPGWGGIPQPTTPRLGADALAAASLIVVPCLGLGRDGGRLGTGGGWYDRALRHRGGGSTVIAWARNAELLDAVPTEPHDLPVDQWITEQGVGCKR